MYLKRLLFSSDLHGNLLQCEKLVKIALKNQVDCILIGGDLSYNVGILKDTGVPSEDQFNISTFKSPEKELVFFEDFVYPIFEEFLIESDHNEIFVVHGNADYSNNLSHMNKIHPQLTVANSDIIELTDQYDLLMYSGTTLLPHGLKDYQRFEWKHRTENFEKEEVFLSGYISLSGSDGNMESLYRLLSGPYEEMDFDNRTEIVDIHLTRKTEHILRREENSIEYEFENLLTRNILLESHQSPKKMIWACHSPIYGCNDLMLKDHQLIHIGSKCLRQFVENQLPELFLSGHAHENYQHSCGQYSTMIGNHTTCVSSCNNPRSIVVSAILVDIFDDRLETSLVQM